MSDNKKYYWLKLKKDFFKKKAIKKLRKIAGGDTYAIIYLEIQLLSIENNGSIFFEGYEETFEEELALELDEDAENVKMTLLYLQKNNLLEIKSEDEYFIPEAAESIGVETAVAERMRKCRAKKRLSQCDVSASQSDSDVTKCYTEIDIEKEKREDTEKETEKELYSPAEPDNTHARAHVREGEITAAVKKPTDRKFKEQSKDIIGYLNAKLGTKYKTDNKKTLELIKSRLREGFTVEDFKTVIDKKAFEWGNDANMCQYLRPVTLFSTKFESYLNQPFTKQMNETDQSIMKLLNGGTGGVWF